MLPSVLFSLAVFIQTCVFAYSQQQLMETTTGDAPFSVDLSALESAVYCPNGIRKAAGGVVLLVHGTGSTGYESWANGPYGVYLPWAAPGFDVCWVDLPRNSLIDAQVSAEYIAYNIPLLAAKSFTGKVSIIGHSQGAGLNPQWALDFWPSIRQYVSDYIALAGDFHGTLEGPVSCLSQDLLHSGCYPSVAQQTASSKYLEAQNERGGSALVTTTSIYTRYDDVIQPEVVNPTSVLPGAANLALQDLNVCGPLHKVDHFTILFDPAAYALAYDALTHDGPASTSRFNAIKYCSSFVNNTALNPARGPDEVRSFVLGSLRTGGLSNVTKVKHEPLLKEYVCDQGQATVCNL